MRSTPLITIVAALVAVATTSPAPADVRCGGAGAVRVGVAPPPPLPETDQPPMPAYGYVWTPGAWFWNPDVNDYYWNPGTWILPPTIGLFWTPGYWGWDSGAYLYHGGYWGPHVGFYGGVRYGFGYWGHGYDGGYWRGRTFFYNRAYNNIGGLHINALYNHRVPEDRLGRRTSFNGGPGGVVASERADERLADRDAHSAATADQTRHFQAAAADPRLRAGFNHGHPLAAGAAGRVGSAHDGAPRAALDHGGASHGGASHVGGGHSSGARVSSAHSHMERGSPVRATHASSGDHHSAAVQPRRQSFYGHSSSAYGGASHESFRAGSKNWAEPRSGQGHEGSPHQGSPRRG